MAMKNGKSSRSLICGFTRTRCYVEWGITARRKDSKMNIPFSKMNIPLEFRTLKCGVTYQEKSVSTSGITRTMVEE